MYHNHSCLCLDQGQMTSSLPVRKEKIGLMHTVVSWSWTVLEPGYYAGPGLFVTHSQSDTLCGHILASRDHVSPPALIKCSKDPVWLFAFCCGPGSEGVVSTVNPTPALSHFLQNNSFHVSNFQITSVTFQISRLAKGKYFHEMESIDRWEERPLTLCSPGTFRWWWWD